MPSFERALGRSGGLEEGVDSLNRLLEGAELFVLALRRHRDERDSVPAASLKALLHALIEVSEEAVVVLLSDGVVFMIVALRALHAQS